LFQDDKLKELVDEIGTDSWKEVASHFSDRTDVQCLHRWQKVLNPELVKGPWTKEVRRETSMLVTDSSSIELKK